MIDRRFVLMSLGASVVSACARVAPITRDRRDPIEGGIGGTGIIGTLTDDTVLSVNGRQVRTTADTQFQIALRAVDDAELGVGHVVMIEAQATPQGLVAERVRKELPLVGRRVPNPGGAGFTVNGVPVRPEPGALDRSGGAARVAVSGLWRDGTMIASRIDRGGEADVLAGIYRDGPDGPHLGGRPIANGPLAGVANGSFVTATGRSDGDAMVVATAEPGRFPGLGADLRLLSVEGFLQSADDPSGFRLAGLGHSFDDRARVASLAQDRAIYEGPYEGAFAARVGVTVPQSLPDRVALLEQGRAAIPEARLVGLRTG